MEAKRDPVHPLYPSGRGLQLQRLVGDSVRLDLGGGMFAWVTVTAVKKWQRGDGEVIDKVCLVFEADPCVNVARGELVQEDAGVAPVRILARRKVA